MNEFLSALPKAELHLHIEGTLEPELMFILAERNRIHLPYASPDLLKSAYDFHNLEQFLDLYYQGTSVLQTANDFYDLAMAYFARCDVEHILHYEVFFDPQAHIRRGISMDIIMDGLTGAQQDAWHHYGASSGLIMSILRDLPVDDALETLKLAKPWQHEIIGIGLDSAEKGNPPGKFRTAFEIADEYGWHRVAHAGEEGPAEYIWEALNELKIRRIDHGVRCVEDPKLVDYLVKHQVPLTVCPLSNVRLGVFPDIAQSNFKQLLDLGLCVTVNSDDPAYFGGYLTQNMLAIQDAFELTQPQWIQLTHNSIDASFAPAERKQALKQRLLSTEVEFQQRASA
ncbi:adenosine deaminase [Echinimonas agarilytica]|uniref:Adenine deaminase n=1 Tax=Echinimonas agarilytica TaxID=1215918 RepID=A0AA41WAZ4_9GAMM|nr:adenosine deaminase [Echinimonas agarilytica]MCM2681358.1 adenosine deaminase [Echinimonas agarilytica]